MYLCLGKQISIPYLSIQEVEEITFKAWKRRILAFICKVLFIQAELVSLHLILLSYSID